MILLQLSAGRGPVECSKAVGLALKAIEKQCREKDIELTIVEAIELKYRHCYKSVLLQLHTNKKDSATINLARQLAQSWQGTMLWVCQSQYRVKHKRKNWFFSGKTYEVNETQLDKSISFQTCRASGAGGQHVNTTDSAVRAIHIETGISVRVESERSQHANKRLASALIFQKLEVARIGEMTQQEKVRWQQHWELERGNPTKIFTGEKFVLLEN